MSTANSLCNLMVQQTDLKKLEDLDPFQTEGFQSTAKINVPVNIIYTDQLGKSTIDQQNLTFQILTRWMKNTLKHKDQLLLQSLRIILTSQDDIFFSFVSNCSNTTFDSIKAKNQLNISFNDFPATFIKLLKSVNGNFNEKNQIKLMLSHEGTGRLHIFEETDYKKLELIELFFQSCNIEKTHQSIIYRYNYNRTKLSMLQNSIQTVYKILAQKNAPLLHYIQKTVGIDQ